jgi:hypothetical protein
MDGRAQIEGVGEDVTGGWKLHAFFTTKTDTPAALFPVFIDWSPDAFCT